MTLEATAVAPSYTPKLQDGDQMKGPVILVSEGRAADCWLVDGLNLGNSKLTWNAQSSAKHSCSVYRESLFLLVVCARNIHLSEIYPKLPIFHPPKRPLSAPNSPHLS